MKSFAKNKTLIRFLCIVLSSALILSGCGRGKDFMVKKDTNPVVYKDTNPVITKEKPMMIRTKTKEAKVLFLHRFTAKPEPYKKLGLSKAYTFYAAQERIAKEGGEWKAFVNNERVILRNYGVTKKGGRQLYGPGYLEPGHFFICKLIKEDEKGNRVYRARFIGQCGNEIPDDDLLVLETPVVITERITTIKNAVYTNKVTYTNVDYEPALWAGLAGLLIGLGLGYLFWFGSGATTVIASTGSNAAIPCPPGIPAPR